MAAKYPEMNWNAHDKADEFMLFKQMMMLSLEDHNITDEKTQARKIQLQLGSKGIRKINNSGLSAQDKEDPNKLWGLFEAQLNLKVNFRIHRMELLRYRQKPTETIDEFVNRCRDKGRECDLTEEDLAERIIELVISSTTSEVFQDKLLSQKKGFTLEQLLDEGRKCESIHKGKQHLENLNTGIGIGTVNAHTKECGNCGRSHPPRSCPAYFDKCDKCGKKGHWSRMCRSGETGRRGRSPDNDKRHRRTGHTRRSSPSRRRNSSQHRNKFQKSRIGEITTEPPEDCNTEETHPIEFHSVEIQVSNVCLQPDNVSKGVYTTLDIVCPRKSGQHKLRLKIDTGADRNTIPLRIIKQMYPKQSWKLEEILQTTQDRLSAYNGTSIKVHGVVDILCKRQESTWTTEPFYVVDVPGPAVLGWPTCNKMKIVTINTVEMSTPEKQQEPVTSIDDLKRRFPDQFDKLSNFKTTAKLHLKEDAEPSIDAPRKCATHKA